MITEIVFLTLFAASIGLLTYFGLYRNHKVFHSITALNSRCANICFAHANEIHTYKNLEEFKREHQRMLDMWDSIVDEKLYNRMLLSFKPLNDYSNWLDEKQMEFILNIK